MHNESNSYKSKGGNQLNKQVGNLLKTLLNDNKIKSFRKEPRYSFPGYQEEQFRPDFEVEVDEEVILVIDNTTTIRSDRLKQKQWDAMGSKRKINENGKRAIYCVLVPNKDVIGNEKTRKKEIKHYQHEKDKIEKKGYFSVIDTILEFDELSTYIEILKDK